MNFKKATNRTRTENTIRNITAGVINKVIILMLPFLVRTFLIRKLGADYVGISSLFTSILQVLNVTELGFASAIIYSLYEPVARNDVEEVRAKVGLLRAVYKIVGIIILVAGIIATPFLQHLIKGTTPDDVNIYIAFWIYLVNTVISYLAFGYKNSILTVYQRNDLISKTNSIVNITKCVIQIAVLFITNSFYVYAIVIPLTTLLGNLITSYLANRLYPELDVKYVFSLSGLGEIKKQIGGIAIGRISLVCRNSFDSIIISSLFGLTLTAVYSNYYYVFSAIGGFMNILITSMSASVGNSLVTESIEKNQAAHIKFDFYYEFLVGVCVICLYTLYQPFMQVWVGENLMLPLDSMSLFCVYFYINHLAQVRSTYSEAAGLWWHFKYLAIAEMFANLILNIVLAMFIGINGILLATIVTAFVFSFLGCTIITYKKLFKSSSKEYFLRNLVYFLVIITGCIIIGFIMQYIEVSGWMSLIIKGIICVCLSIAYLYIVYTIYKPTHNELNGMIGMLRGR